MALSFDDTEFQTRCPECRSTGEVLDGRGVPSPCVVCRGRGYIPTELGEKVLDLVRRNFGVEMGDFPQFDPLPLQRKG